MIMKNPWILLPSEDDERYSEYLPDYLAKPSETAVVHNLKDAIRRFFVLSELLYTLKKSKKSWKKEYPFRFETRDVYKWNVGETIVVDDDKTLIW